MHRMLIFSISILIGCSASPQPPWSEVKNRLLGRTYEEVVTCAGVPDGITTVSEGIGAILYREHVSTPRSTCESTLLIKDGRVANITQRQNNESSTASNIVWPNYTLCSKRFESCPWTR
jgi:hypothetical protein